MDDYISRKAAIEALKKAIPSLSTPGTGSYDVEIQATAEDFVDAIQIVNSIKSSDVRPVVRGRWGDDDCCTNCGEEADYNWERGVHYYSNFCPNCGADMREEQNETDLV